MNKPNIKKIIIILGIFLGLEIFSFLGFSFPFLNQIIFFLLAASVLALSLYKLEYGLLFVLAELIIGSKGYLFYFPLESGLISIRVVAWSILMLVFAGNFIKQLFSSNSKSEYLEKIRKFVFLKQYLILGAFILIGLISGFVYKNSLSDILLDFNAWIYFLILLPALVVDFKKENIKNIFIAGAIWISLKTLILLAIFSNNFSFAPAVYGWLRKTLVGEMTNASGWKRVFIQSQIFSVIAYFFILFETLKFENLREWFSRKNIIYVILAGLFFSTLLISLSRSFWAGFAVATITGIIFIFKRYSLRRAILAISWLLVSALLAIIMIFAATPLLAGNLQNQILNRLGNNEEAALVSRWTLLPELIKEIKVNPILGQGFGSTLTYISSDPRILEKDSSGKYTTYAFEWGYLDMWLKIGVLGVLAYLWLLYSLIRSSIKIGLKGEGPLYLGIMSGIIFLAIVHVFTPYLNHPLGIGFIIISSCLIQKDRVY